MKEYERVFRKLEREGKVTRDEVAEYLQEGELEERKEWILSELHAIFCTANHDTDECNWYGEEGECRADDVWLEPTHSRWLLLFTNFLASANLPKFKEEGITEEPTGSPDFGGSFT